MSVNCECLYPLAQKHVFRAERSYSILSAGESGDYIENYLLIPVEGTGFVVIKQVIDLE